MTPAERLLKAARRWRKERGLSQEDMAWILGIDRTAYCRLERGQRTLSYNEGMDLREVVLL